jgi:threonine aldolase
MLTAIGLVPVWPVEANIVFVALPAPLDAALRAAGAEYYVRPNQAVTLGQGEVLARLVTSFATRDEEIDAFVDLCRTWWNAQGPPQFRASV